MRRNSSKSSATCLSGSAASSSFMLLVVGQLALLLSCGQVANAQRLQLAGGSYSATTNPINEANLALDAAAIKESTDIATKKKIYTDGGDATTGKSLSQLSLEAATLMKDDDMFNVFRYAFNYIGNVKEHEDLNHFDDEDVGVYAHTIVEDLFDLNTENIETDAALVTTVWMTVVHYLYEAMNECKATATTAGSDSPSGEAALDKAAAFWIGIGQEFGENESGHLLYNLAEKAGARFGQDNIEAEVNTNIIALLNQIKTDVIQPGACKQPDGYLQFRWIMNKIIAQMTVPLVQNLYHYSSEQNEKFLELYALALLPQIAACSMAEFDWFLEELVMKDLKQQDFPEVVSRLQALYPCLGITCQDVGSYKNGAISKCSDSAVVNDIAGYTPERDVSEILKLDRDVLRIKILTGWEAYDAAADIYVNGRNSMQDGSLLSLQSIATSSERSVVPEFDWFKTYYNDDDNYADTVIQDAFKGSASTNFPGASPDQLQGVVFRLLQTLVTPMYSLQEMHKAINLCGSDSKAAEDAWDRGAALYIGSGEGTEAGGTGSGVLLHSLANEVCDKFGTCDDGGRAQANGDMIDFFQRGKESLSDGSCAALPNPTLPARLIGDMRLAMIQGTLHFAAVNDKLGVNSREGSIGEGFGASRSILPYLNQVNAFDSRSVDKNMAYASSGGKPVPDGYVEVFSSIANALKKMEVDCGDVGVYTDVVANGDMCALANGGAVPVPPTQSETANNSDATAAAATAREIWNDTNGGSYPWRPSDPCISHPTHRGRSEEAYTNAIVALTEVLNNPKVTRDLERNMLFNTKAFLPVEQCESLLAMVEEMLQVKFFPLPENIRNALVVARDEFMARTEPEPTITMLPAQKFSTGTKCGAFDMILDIRSKEEWDAGHIMGATHMDLSNNKDAEQTMKQLEGCKQCRVAVFDEEGPKMKNATRFLLGGGFERLYGGFNISQMDYQMVNMESVEPKCVSEGAGICTSQISRLFCPVKLKQLSKPVEKMGIEQLTSLVPTEADADLEYCNSLDRFRVETSTVALDGEFPDMTIKLARKFRKKAKKLMKQRDCLTFLEK